MKKVLLILLLVIVAFPAIAQSKRIHYEKTYQKYFCDQIGGGTEYYLLDRSGRVDCITKDYAIEVDFANKYTEGVSQALYYGMKTDRKAGLLLIVENNNERKYVERAEGIIKHYNLPIKLWTITPEDLKGD